MAAKTNSVEGLGEADAGWNTDLKHAHNFPGEMSHRASWTGWKQRPKGEDTYHVAAPKTQNQKLLIYVSCV